MSDPLHALGASCPYKGLHLSDWLDRWIEMPKADLARGTSQFLTTMITWVVRTVRSGRRGGDPTGNLGRFCLPESQPVNLFDVLASKVIDILRKRGLVETDRQPTELFRRLVDAFDRTPTRKEGV